MRTRDPETVVPPRWRVESDAGEDPGLTAFLDELGTGGAAEHLGTLRRRTVALHRFRLADGDEIVVKVFPTRSSAELAFAALDRLAQLLEAAPAAVRALPPLALATSHPAVAMPYLPGPTLRDLLVGQPWKMQEMFARAGDVLAAVHQQCRYVPDGESPPVLSRRARAASLGTTAEAAAAAELVRRRVDFHPHNLVIDHDGSLVVIDPPIHDEVSHVHHDMVNFIYKAQKCLVTPPWNRRRARYLLDLREAAGGFLTAYFARAGRDMSTADLILLERYLALYASLSSRDARRREDLPHLALFGPLLRQQLRRALREMGVGAPPNPPLADAS